MRVAVLNNMAPFVRGGAELLAERLCRELEARGHETELIRLPLDWSSPESVLASAASAASVRTVLTDRVIALKYPAYLAPHGNLVVWLVHPFRQVHDLWDTPNGWSSADQQAVAAREAILTMDKLALARARRVFAISDVIASRLRAVTGISAEVLMTPPTWSVPMPSGPFGNYVLALGRVGAAKRQHLLVQALAAADTDLRLVIAGPPDSQREGERLRELVDRLGIGDRIELRLEFIPEDEKRQLLAHALAVAYLPIEEDSYGYVCLEAFQAGKPVVTAQDSGGTHTLVKDGLTGWVVEPTPEAIGATLTWLGGHRVQAPTMGARGRDLAAGLPLDWDFVVERLLA